MHCMCRWAWCVGPSVHELFWAVIVRQKRHTDLRQHNGSQHQSHNNLVCLCLCLCVCAYVCVCACLLGVHLYFKASFVWLTLYYDE